MKQIIEVFNDGTISDKYYKNDRGLVHGLYIAYYTNGFICHKCGYINGSEHGLYIKYFIKYKGKIKMLRYYL